MTARPIFVGGTASHVGKSWVATALCRYLYRMGHRVAPFKAQNMSNNSMACPGGGEIGRAQAAQAEACGLAPHPDMNPILLKPTGLLGSQVVLDGRPWRNLTAGEYGKHFPFLSEKVFSAYARLASRYDYIVVEGAGSVAELNLQQTDLVNLSLAERLDARAILVADIDRGGVFAAVIGTLALLGESQSALIRSFLVNRFRGDRTLFADGVRILEERSGRPCLGVFPYAADIYLDAEDSVSIEDAPPDEARPRSRAAIVRLPHISNFTDFRHVPDAVFVADPVDENFEVIFLPGTKSPIEDLGWLRRRGLDRWIAEQMARGGRVVGVCGGFQIMGEEIQDPDGVESTPGSARGLGLLPARTRLAREKTTRMVSAATPSGIRFDAYEIHLGVTELDEAGEPPFAVIEDGTRDGIRRPQAIGTYLHGALENPLVVEELLGRPVPAGILREKRVGYDRLADWFAAHVEHDVFLNEYLEG